MKISKPLVFSLGVGALILQGCATTGTAPPNNASAPAANPAPAAAPVAQAMSSPAASIPEENGKPVVKADTKNNFAAIAAAIHQQMQPGGRWQFIDNNERAMIDNSFADMGKLYDQFGSVGKMDQNAKMRLLADQSTVNAILTKKDGDRLICQSEMPVGSHLPVKTCKTYAQIQAEQRGAQQALQNYDKNHYQNTNSMGGGH